MTSASINPKTGKKTDKTDITKEVPVSKVATTGFANPAVVAVEVNLAALVVPDMAVAVPPPAIMAKAQVITGLKSATVDTMTAVPATAANGTAIESKKLSTTGM